MSSSPDLRDTAGQMGALREAVSGLMPQARQDLAELVSYRSVADAKQFPPEECEKAAQWVVEAFTAAGLQDVRASPTPDGSHAVHGHAPGPAGSPTVLLYCHYDVQPPLGEDAWNTPVWELCQEIDRAARRVIADAGRGDQFIHRTGHGIGLTTHEPPYMVEGEEHLLEPGICFSIEPGVYVPDRFGVRIEDIVTVTADGGRRFNNTNREIQIVG
jgi:hypothetical protein